MKLVNLLNYLKTKFRINYYKVQLENPINSSKEDVIGFDSEVKRLKSAIKQGANTVGLISDFASGKSFLIHLLKKKLCFLKYKIVKINLWDDELSDTSGDKVSSDSIVKLHKTFLRQLSMQHHRYKINYINRRLNLNYGIAKISFPNYRTLFTWLLCYLVVIGGLVFLTVKYFLGINSFDTISYSEKLLFLNKVVTLVPMIFLIFIVIFIVFNKEVLFSLWNNSKDRKITEEDTIQLYNDLVAPIFPRRFRKLLIVIEDLDRINNKSLVKYYINEFYRIYVEGNNKRCKNGITFIFCIKDEFLYQSLNKKLDILGENQDNHITGEEPRKIEIIEIAKNDRKFIKLFDYICNLPSIYINDYDEVLKQQVNKDKLLKHLINTREIKIDDLQWLTRGDDLNIRVIKNRIELFKSIYLRLLQKSKEISKKDKVDINIKMCAFASFVKSEYPNNLYDILENTYTEDNQNYIDIKINEFLINGEAKLEAIDDNNNLKKDIVELINNKIIDEEYKKYFYNIPKGIKPLTVNQTKVSKYIIDNSIPKTFESFDLLIDMCNKNSFIYKQLEKRLTLGRGMPSIVFLNTILFENAKKFNNELETLAKKLFVINDSNVENVCKFLSEIQESNISKSELSIFLKKYIQESITFIEDNSISSEVLLKYREALYNCLGDDIVNIKELYDKYEIEESEISKINNPYTLLALCETLSQDKQETIMLKRFNEINNLDFNALIELVKKFKNISIILKLNNLDRLEESRKREFYEIVIKEIKGIDVERKIKLLILLNYYDVSITKSIIDDLDNNKNNEQLYVDYVNKIGVFDDYSIKYFVKIPRVYKLSNQNLEKFKEYDNEKYLVYKSLNSNVLQDDLIENKKLLRKVFIKYKELTYLFNNNLEAINILINSKIYLKINSNDINDKIMVFSTAKQNIDLISFALNSDIVDEDIKNNYFSSISNLDVKTGKYLYNELIEKRGSIPVSIKKSIYKNRTNIFKELKSKDKRSIARILTNDINDKVH